MALDVLYNMLMRMNTVYRQSQNLDDNHVLGRVKRRVAGKPSRVSWCLPEASKNNQHFNSYVFPETFFNQSK